MGPRVARPTPGTPQWGPTAENCFFGSGGRFFGRKHWGNGSGAVHGVGRTERARCDWRGNAAGRPRMHARSIVAKRRRQSHLAQCAVSSSPSLLVLPLRRQWDGLPFESNAGGATQVGEAQGKSSAPVHYRSRQMAARAPDHRPMRAAAVLHGSSVRARTMDGVPTLALTCTAPRDAIGRIIADVRPGSCGVWTPHLRAHNGPRFSSPRPSPRHPCSRPLSRACACLS